MDWKQRPHLLTSERFRGVPDRLRRTIARLIGGTSDDVVLSNSASYGLHLIANGLRWRTGDEVLVMDSDFPSDILPWLRLENRGVSVRRARPAGSVFDVDEIRVLIGPKTRLLCLTWVHSFSGWAIDLEAVGEVCRAHNVFFVVNASQAIGARPVDVSQAPVDALVSVGFKWLCGPYGTGFCWLHPRLRELVDPQKAYWLSMLTADDLEKAIHVDLKREQGIEAFDIFGTANFFNFVPWTAALDYLLGLGIDRIAEYDQLLVARFLDGLDRRRYTVLSPAELPRRSTLVLLRHVDSAQTDTAYAALSRSNVHCAIRAGSIRVAPHFYNTAAEIDSALSILNSI